MWLQVCGFAIILWLLYRLWISNFSYWKDRGFPYIEPEFPFGTSESLAFMNKFQGHVVQDVYDKMGDLPYVGIVQLRRPHLLLKDPEIIKAVFLKDFNHFTDRINADAVKDPLSKHLFNIGGNQWKSLRVKMTPTFTSGKLKKMFPLFLECVTGLESLLSSAASSGVEIDTKDIMARFMTDIIGSCAFGLDIKSLRNPNSEFRLMASLFLPNHISLKKKLKSVLYAVVPGLEKYFRFRLHPEVVEKFMTDVVRESITYRRSTGTKRNDFIDLLLEIKEQGSLEEDKKNVQEIDDLLNDSGDFNFIAQVFVFFAAGFETASSVSSYCLFELAINKEVQDKLRKEILSVTNKHGGVTYEAVKEMQYLDQVVSETMRKYPTVPVLTRKCTNQYRMPDRPDLILEKDIRLLIPVFALHRDPKYFPNPDKFDPERFSPENKNSIPQFAYLPFGEGPRICIGMRFGLLQVKMGLITCLSKYEFCRTKNTVEPMELIASPTIAIVKDPIKLLVKELKNI